MIRIRCCGRLIISFDDDGCVFSKEGIMSTGVRSPVTTFAVEIGMSSYSSVRPRVPFSMAESLTVRISIIPLQIATHASLRTGHTTEDEVERERVSEREPHHFFFHRPKRSAEITGSEMGDAMENHDGVLWETELRLGLPGGGGGGDRRILLPPSASGKRGFSETVDLKLNLGPKEANLEEDKAGDVKDKDNLSFSAKPPSKAQVVGWPPVRSFRRNATAVQKRSGGEEEQAEKGSSAVCGAALVKVSMDGAPYLRKVDLKTFKSYQQLSDALGKMFSSFTNAGECNPQGMQDFMNESKLMDLLNSTDYVPTYEDKDGDWMLVGDVPWEMFVESCKRLRIMKSTEARGLAPRAIEKCKTRG